jgi:hypothetical protein
MVLLLLNKGGNAFKSFYMQIPKAHNVYDYGTVSCRNHMCE